MPIRQKVFVVKRGEGKGYAGIVNALFYGDNCDMVYGDAQAVLIKMIEAVRGLGLPTVVGKSK
jgi:NAD(P) transhydrogenase subunit beta